MSLSDTLGAWGVHAADAAASAISWLRVHDMAFSLSLEVLSLLILAPLVASIFQAAQNRKWRPLRLRVKREIAEDAVKVTSTTRAVLRLCNHLAEPAKNPREPFSPGGNRPSRSGKDLLELMRTLRDNIRDAEARIDRRLSDEGFAFTPDMVSAFTQVRADVETLSRSAEALVGAMLDAGRRDRVKGSADAIEDALKAIAESPDVSKSLRAFARVDPKLPFGEVSGSRPKYRGSSVPAPASPSRWTRSPKEPMKAPKRLGRTLPEDPADIARRVAAELDREGFTEETVAQRVDRARDGAAYAPS